MVNHVPDFTSIKKERKANLQFETKVWGEREIEKKSYNKDVSWNYKVPGATSTVQAVFDVSDGAHNSP
jgi:hypothetical protein